MKLISSTIKERYIKDTVLDRRGIVVKLDRVANRRVLIE